MPSPLNLRSQPHLPTSRDPLRPYGEALDLVELLGFAPTAIYHEQLPPNHAASVRHAHTQRQEALLLLSGNMEAEIAGTVWPLVPDDLLRFPVGFPHQVRNTGKIGATYLVFADDPEEDEVLPG